MIRLRRYGRLALWVFAVAAWTAPHSHAATIQVSSSTGVRDSNGTTPLVGNGLGGNSDYVQCIYSGADARIDPPQSDGQPTGDDILLDAEEFPGQFFTVIGEGFPFNPHEGKFLEDFKHSLVTGSRIYIRAWNAAAPEDATHYGDSALYAITNQFGETHDFGSWSTDMVNVTQVQLTVLVFGQGGTSPSAGVHTFNRGQVVTVRATAEPGWLFTRWEGNLSGSINPTTILMDQNKTVAAVFIEEPPDVFTVTTVPSPVEGGTIEPFQGSELYVEDDEVTLAAMPNEGWQFDHWEGDLSSSNNPVTFTVTSDVTAVAVFTVRPPDNFTLTVGVQGQGTTSPPAGANIVPSNQESILVATPAEGWLFIRWQGGITTTSNPASIFMDGDKSVTAVFAQEPKSVLSAAAVGLGSIGLNPPGGIYDIGEVVTVSASPAAGWRFDHWEGDLSGSLNPAQIVMNVNKQITAVFVETTGIRLTAQVQGQGSISLNPPGGAYDHGVVVAVTATPSPGWEFDHWEIDLTGSQNPGQVTMTRDKLVRAVFVRFPIRSLTTQASGQGTVTLLPPGGSYPHNTLVNISASPVAGWRFDHWEGALDGRDNPKLLRLDSDKHVVAVFVSRGGNPDCTLANVAIAAPANDTTVFVPGTALEVPFTMAAEPSCLADTLRVELKLDGASITIDTTPPFTATVPDLAQLSPGPHLIQAIATAADGVRTVSATSSFNLEITDAALDADGNGLPDDPFSLLGDGDSWLAVLPTRSIVAVLWTGGARKQTDAAITAAVRDLLHSEREVVVTVPPNVAQEGETALLIAAASEDLSAILDGDTAPLIDSEPSTGLLPGGQYVEISILLTDDGGATFDEIDANRLETSPVHLSMGGFEFGLFGIESFFRHPTFVEGGGEGIRIVPDTGPWSDDHTVNLEFDSSRLSADLTALSVVAPFFRPQSAPVIQGITPDSGSRDGGTQVIISGTGLNRPTEVSFGGVRATVESSGDTDIIVVTPANLEGPVDVTVRTGGGSDTVLSGYTYTLPTEPPAVLSVSPLGHTFGLVPVGTTRTKAFLVQNTGGGLLTGSAFVDAPFSIVSNGTYELGPKEAQTVMIMFAPQSEQEYQGMLSFTGAGKTAILTLRGTGTPASTMGPGCAAQPRGNLSWSDILLLGAVLAVVGRRAHGMSKHGDAVDAG